ncbi:GmrSD restriction endonuclease domain-containing protein [Mycoplasmoides pirum]|uniref:GmrSD restriction endonuclease domain-containing protein n=1 Tax=Mycoplasmoides pirum TaxID=2122 RepID=UPI000AD2896B|nr:DUF262 domain-containing protein [Mycoplasmoides pirum]
MKKPTIKTISIFNLINSKDDYNPNSWYQRNEAWKNKNKQSLINSIINDFYIPPILVASKQIVDGKQRFLALKDFIDGKFSIPLENINNQDFKNELDKELSNEELLKFKKNTISYSEMPPKIRRKWIEDKEIFIVDLGSVNEDDIIDLFKRINKNSIKLNAYEELMSSIPKKINDMLKQIIKNSKINELSNSKTLKERFGAEYLISRCITILNMPATKKDVRKQIKDVINKYPLNKIEEEIKKCSETIDLMYSLLDNDTLGRNAFKTNFETIFCSLYENLKSKNCFIKNKYEIKSKINLIIDELRNDQMGGGTKYDSIEFVKSRIKKIDKILNDYLVDNKRTFNYDVRLEIWKKSDKKCNICKRNILNFNECEIDHIIPFAKGGKTELHNMQILCILCNRKKSLN